MCTCVMFKHVLTLEHFTGCNKLLPEDPVVAVQSSCQPFKPAHTVHQRESDPSENGLLLNHVHSVASLLKPVQSEYRELKVHRDYSGTPISNRVLCVPFTRYKLESYIFKLFREQYAQKS